MAGRIDYDIEKYQFTEAGETPRLREQWREVYLECRQLRAGAEAVSLYTSPSPRDVEESRMPSSA
ncbi:hypothetical protein LOCUS_54030 [Klebsiella pneumoniae]|nr:hypothetical protein LOCUS_54030 [Klebsiella pneumoniae]